MAGDIRNIVDVTLPNLIGQPSVSFRPNDFDAVIWQHGYDVICEKAIRCPCQGSSGAPIPSCQNCHGSGYFYINPTRTKALITGLNRETKYVQWTPELIGTAAISVRDLDKHLISYFDRITVEDEVASFTEMLQLREVEIEGEEMNVQGFFTSYAPIDKNSIKSIWMYNGFDRPLYHLSPDNYEINENNPYFVIVHNPPATEGLGVSILYNHRVEYHIIDMPHEIRASLQTNKSTGALEVIKMPLQSIGRRTHLIDIQRPDFDGSGIITNDYDSNTP